MRKLILAPMALACLIGAAQAQQSQKFTADQGAAGGAPWPVSWTGQSVLADLRVAGSAVAAGNPVPVSVGNFPATQQISAAALPLPSGAATSANQTTEIAALNAANLRTAYVTEANNSAAGANATISGSARDAGTSPSAYTKCSAVVNSTQAGTLQLWMNPDGAVWIQIGQVAVTANVPASLTLPIFGRYCQVRYANGPTAGTFSAFTSLTTN